MTSIRSNTKSAARNRRDRAISAAVEGRSLRAYGAVSTKDKNERKRQGRLRALPGYKPARQDAHVVAWKAHMKSPAVKLSGKPHSAHVNAWRKACSGAAWTHKYRNDPDFNTREKVRARLRKMEVIDADVARLIAGEVKRSRWPNGWEALLGYGVSDLVSHLRRTLPARRTWQEFMAGSLHIDHIVPRRLFDLTNPAEVRACWALSNLRLLPAADNMRKAGKQETLL